MLFDPLGSLLGLNGPCRIRVVFIKYRFVVIFCKVLSEEIPEPAFGILPPIRKCLLLDRLGLLFEYFTKHVEGAGQEGALPQRVARKVDVDVSTEHLVPGFCIGHVHAVFFVLRRVAHLEFPQVLKASWVFAPFLSEDFRQLLLLFVFDFTLRCFDLCLKLFVAVVLRVRPDFFQLLNCASLVGIELLERRLDSVAPLES